MPLSLLTVVQQERTRLVDRRLLRHVAGSRTPGTNRACNYRVMVLRYSAFTDDPAGGNPAGVVLDASQLSDAQMQEIAREVNYSESAFATQRDEAGEYDVRYFSPEAE